MIRSLLHDVAVEVVAMLNVEVVDVSRYGCVKVVGKSRLWDGKPMNRNQDQK
jgi:hypothetical protein